MKPELRKKLAKKILRKLTHDLREHLTPDSLVIIRHEEFVYTNAYDLKTGDIIVFNMIPGLDAPPSIDTAQICVEMVDQVQSFQDRVNSDISLDDDKKVS